MSKQVFFAFIGLLVFAACLQAQDTAPTPTPTPIISAAQQQMDQLQQQIDLLKKQQDFEKAKNDLANERLKEIMSNMPHDSNLKIPEGKTTFSTEKEASAETASLSYAALKELSTQIEAAMRPATSQYAGIVVYNEPDFAAVAKYRLYRGQAMTAIKNYKVLVQRLADLDRNKDTGAEFNLKSLNIDPISTALNLPAIGSSFVRSVADLLSVFRTDTTITESRDTVDDASLATAMSNAIRNANPNLKIYYPKAFAPEYDLESEGSDSILVWITNINAANADVGDFLGRCGELPDPKKNTAGMKEIVAYAKIVKRQLDALAIGDDTPVAGRAAAGKGDTDSPKTGWNEVRSLMRAEKLDRFLRQGSAGLGSVSGPKVGILKLRSLASGGSRRETRNLFLGNHISYSGSVTIEVLLFDINGELLYSEIFSSHTGFRKLKTVNK